MHHCVVTQKRSNMLVYAVKTKPQINLVQAFILPNQHLVGFYKQIRIKPLGQTGCI